MVKAERTTGPAGPHGSGGVIGGVDCPSRTHHGAALDERGRVLGDREFPATRTGYAQLLAWLRVLRPTISLDTS